MTNPIQSSVIESLTKYGCISAPVIVIIGIALYANGAFERQETVDPNRAFADTVFVSVRDAMKDPTSVKFKDVTASAKAGCMRGQLLAKNGLGAYDGYRDFVWIKGETFVSYADKASPLSTAADIQAVIAYSDAANECLKAMTIETVDDLPLDIPEA